MSPMSLRNDHEQMLIWNPDPLLPYMLGATSVGRCAVSGACGTLLVAYCAQHELLRKESRCMS